MNSKSFFLCLALIAISSCGKKGPPKVPADSVLPSYEDHFINQNKIENQKVLKEEEEEENAKKKSK